MVTLEQAAKAWADLGRVMCPSLAEVEVALAGQSHSTVDAHTMTSQQTHESEED